MKLRDRADNIDIIEEKAQKQKGDKNTKQGKQPFFAVGDGFLVNKFFFHKKSSFAGYYTGCRGGKTEMSGKLKKRQKISVYA